MLSFLSRLYCCTIDLYVKYMWEKAALILTKNSISLTAECLLLTQWRTKKHCQLMMSGQEGQLLCSTFYFIDNIYYKICLCTREVDIVRVKKEGAAQSKWNFYSYWHCWDLQFFSSSHTASHQPLRILIVFKKWNLSSILEHGENFDSYSTLQTMQTLADICWFWRWKRCDDHLYSSLICMSL